MKRLILPAIATAVMTSVAIPTLAQDYSQRNQTYLQDRAEYERQMRAYEAARDRYERDRAAYDRRYGIGAYERYYGRFSRLPPVYDPYYDDYAYSVDRYGRDTAFYDGTAYDPYRYYINSDCERRYRSANRTGGTLLGALIGGAIGAAAAGDSSETEGAILGAVVGGALGNNIAGNSSTATRYAARCDANGYYFTYDQTLPYRENTRYRNGRYDASYYARNRCRLAVAPANYSGRTEFRYVRVCPDRNNRYRITS